MQIQENSFCAQSKYGTYIHVYLLTFFLKHVAWTLKLSSMKEIAKEEDNDYVGSEIVSTSQLNSRLGGGKCYGQIFSLLSFMAISFEEYS
jgi:hypothetical protein